MKRLLLSALLLTAATAMAQTPMMSPPDRRFYVTSIGDVLEWQPGLGFVVFSGVKTQTVTRVGKRRVTSDGKSIIRLERPSRIERSIEIESRREGPRPADLEAPRPRPSAQDEGESLMEEVEPGRVIR